jgi:uncharacterized YccA/Bax inhibitor family protein
MAFYRSSNPALKTESFESDSNLIDLNQTMTIQGTVAKTALMGVLVFAAALFVWYQYIDAEVLRGIELFMGGGFLGGFVLALVIIFKKKTAPYLAPVYAVLEGLALGGLSVLMELRFPGIVLQAILLTMGILFGLLFIYRAGLIKVTENFKLMVASATMGIALVYLVSFVGSFFDFQIPMIHEGGTIGIIFSLVVVAIASLNLVMDFDFIEEAAENKVPKYMEWYGAFGLMVTLIWLYIEILRLLSKLRD